MKTEREWLELESARLFHKRQHAEHGGMSGIRENTNG